MDEADGYRAIANCGGHTLDRAVPGIAHGEHARDRGLERERNTPQRPVLTGVGPSENESPLVARYRVGPPVRKRPGRWRQIDNARFPVPEQQMLKMRVAATAGDLAPVTDINVWRGLDLADQIVRHARREGLRANEDRDVLGVFRHMQRGLPGRVPAAHDEGRSSGYGLGFDGARTIK